MDLSIIVVNYKSKDFTDACIKSIYDSTHKIAFEIIVVDNNSSDGCIEMLKKKYPKVKSIQSNENVGFFRASNFGVRLAVGRYLLFLNPDTVIHDGALDKMVEIMDANTEVGVAGCRIESPDHTLEKAGRRSFPIPIAVFFRFFGLKRYDLSFVRKNKQTEVDFVPRAFIMFRNEILEDIGGLDEEFSMYTGDIDFCYRAKRNGWKVMYYPQVKITHFHKESDRLVSMKETKAYYDSIAIFYRKNLEKKTFFPVRFLVYYCIWSLKQFAILIIMIKSKFKVEKKS